MIIPTPPYGVLKIFLLIKELITGRHMLVGPANNTNNDAKIGDRSNHCWFFAGPTEYYINFF